MKIVVTGNQGYVGSTLTRHLRQEEPDAEIIGFDAGYFAHSLTGCEDLPERQLSAQYVGDVRDLPAALLEGADAVVHLAAVSNDPIGARFEAVTDDINRAASLALAAAARTAGVRRFVFASSCSVYGFTSGAARREDDDLAPLTAYARSKVATEQGLGALAGDAMVVTCLRFATACGMSDRLRLDLVLNDFIASALATGRIDVLSDGTPWRPLIDVADMARAIEWALRRPADHGGAFLAVNVGSDPWNHRIGDLAEAVAARIPGTSVSIDRSAAADRRSYRVAFDLFRDLAPHHQPVVTLEASIDRLVAGLGRMGFADRDFRRSGLIRLNMLKRHIEAGRLDEALRWRDRGREGADR